ncbi:Smr/MutS family protein [Hyphomicrobium sp. 2TAF46]|uniref:Smr/MutS family protein n=1 Tax=Hyphomicrobium sp. 2TAF46 TaxID=3233019 RepID=UPI003F925905
MKKQHGHSGGKGRRPSEDSDPDQDIWRHTAATIEPLKRGKPRFHPASDAVKAGVPRPKPGPESERPPVKARAAHPQPPGVSPAKPVAAKTPELQLFDRNSVRKLRGGRADIEARVDLHGMRQDEAHAELRRFLFSCQRRGLRFVLVITGKGKTNGGHSEEVYSERERGVLKRNVPRWLDEPELRAIVVSFTAAAIQHGGEGAIYVHLRSKNRL